MHGLRAVFRQTLNTLTGTAYAEGTRILGWQRRLKSCSCMYPIALGIEIRNTVCGMHRFVLNGLGFRRKLTDCNFHIPIDVASLRGHGFVPRGGLVWKSRRTSVGKPNMGNNHACAIRSLRASWLYLGHRRHLKLHLSIEFEHNSASHGGSFSLRSVRPPNLCLLVDGL